MVGKISVLGWSSAVLLFVVVVGAPGVVYASLDGRRRTAGLLSVLAVEAVLVVALGLLLRWRSRR